MNHPVGLGLAVFSGFAALFAAHVGVTHCRPSLFATAFANAALCAINVWLAFS